MTDEDFVRGWLERQWGREFNEKYPIYAAGIRHMLAAGVLETAGGPNEGTTMCSCQPNILNAPSVRFYLSEDAFMDICVKCDSWAVYDSLKKIRKDKGIE